MRRRGCAIGVLIAVGVSAVVPLLAVFWLRPDGLTFSADPRPWFFKRHGVLVDVTSEETAARGEYLIEYLSLKSSSGLVARIAVKSPQSPPRERLPVVVLVGGFERGRDAVDLVDVNDVVVVGVSYPYLGPQHLKGVDYLLALRSLRLALYDVTPAIGLAMDFLTRQDHVDSSRVELVGVSLGSVFACTAGAVDPRFSRVWAVHGGGDVRALLDHSLSSSVANSFARARLTDLGCLLVEKLDPDRFVADIAPRPFVMINAQNDQFIPGECARDLFEAGREPKEHIWLPTGHVGDGARDVIPELIEIVVSRIRETVPID